MDWGDLRFALVVAREGTLAGAARSLGVNHSTVLRRIRGLEDRLGVSLFERHARGYVTTPAGDELVATAEEIERQTDVLERRLGGHDQRLSGSVKVSTADVTAEHLSVVLGAFRSAYPKIAVELDVSIEARNLEQGETDIALRVTNQPGESLFGRRLSGIGFAVYAATSYLEGRREPIHAESVDWVVMSEHTGGFTSFGAWQRAHVPEERIAARMGAALPVFTAIRSGLGVGVLACGHADMSPDLVRLGGVLSDIDLDLWLLTHPDLRKVARVRVVMDWIVRAFEEKREVVEGARPRVPPRPALTWTTAD